MNTSNLTQDQFVQISSALLGISTQQLDPPHDPIGLPGTYLETLSQFVDTATLNALSAAFPPGFDPQQAASQALANPAIGPVCRSIMKVWLLGSWYDPKQPTQAVEVVSAQAYKESLIWKAMQSHPMGYSMFTFGYWSETPPALSKFIQLTPSNNPS